MKSLAEFVYIDAIWNGASIGWWNPGSSSAEEEWRTSKLLLIDTLGKDHYDGVFAFSLGAAAISLLLSELRAEGKDMGVNFICVFSGFSPSVCNGRISDPSDPLNLPGSDGEVNKFGIPSFHCWGLADAIIPAAMSRTLADRFASPTIMEHEGGHLVPSGARKPLKQFLQRIAAGRSK
jgi:pimeloyl-ACP methyl ester carboxylesterase